MKRLLILICMCGMVLSWAVPCNAQSVVLYYFVEDDQAIITDFETSIECELTIPSEIEGYPVTRIGQAAFSGCTMLTGITLPDTLTVIDDDAFFGCTGLTEVYIPEGVHTIVEDAFANCTNLTNVVLPESLRTLGNFAFSSCPNLQEIDIPDGVASIGVAAFCECTGLRKVTLPDSLTVLEASTFAGCSNLKEVHLNDGLTTINDSAFFCSGLEKITIPASVTQIGNDVFSYSGISQIHFLGSAPSFSAESLFDVTATAYYHNSNGTWTEDVRQGYGGKIQWVERHIFNQYLSDQNATCTTDGTKTAKCEFCDATDTIPDEGSRGHRYVDGKCQNCGGSCNHSYSDGTCAVCGAADPDYIKTTVPTLTLTAPSLTFRDEVIYNVYFTVDDMSSVVEMGMITFDSRLENGTIADAVDIIPGYYTSGSTYSVSSNGIPAKNLGDALYFKAYAKLSDGSYAYSGIAGYNAVAYANAILGSSSYGNDIKALVVALLNYGAAAQVQFNYKTDSLMNAGISAANQALVAAYDESMIADVVKADSSKVGIFVHNGGYTAINPSVSFEGAFSINYYLSTKYTPDAAPTFYYWDAETYASADALTIENAIGQMTTTKYNGNWIGTVSGIAARQVGETCYAAAVYTYGGTTYVTPILAYSLGSYCKTLADGGNELGAATAVYGYYAAAYFNK